jgi:hypothetical protein
MPRFVLLQHTTPPHYARPSHWDFMLEHGEQLMTWALVAAPRPIEAIVADRLPDHRLAYLDYQGPVSGDRGHVIQCDAGSFQWLQNEPRVVEVYLSGRQLEGRVILQRNSDSTADGEDKWSFVYYPESNEAEA